jgi:hypothetical protein
VLNAAADWLVEAGFVVRGAGDRLAFVSERLPEIREDLALVARRWLMFRGNTPQLYACLMDQSMFGLLNRMKYWKYDYAFPPL